MQISRVSDVQDLNKIADLIQIAVADMRGFYNEGFVEYKTKFDAEHLTKRLSDPDFMLWKGEIEGQVVAFGIVTTDSDIAYLELYGVDANHRKQGLGRQMLGGIRKDLAENRSDLFKLSCDSAVTNLAANSSLMKSGYEIITQLENHWYGQDHYLWELLLRETV